jgi:polysaccharide biosynthesis protein VpsQ
MKWLTVVFILFIIAIVVLADAGRLPGVMAGFYNFRYGDKAGHFLLMGLLNFLVILSFTMRPQANLRRTVLICSLVVAALVSLEEGSQLFFPLRTASWGDLFSSYAGIILFGGLAFWIRTRRNQRVISE